MGQYTSYYTYQKYENRGGAGWLPSYPNKFSINGEGTMPLSAKSECDAACGCQVEPQYKWENMNPSYNYYCDECPEAMYRWYPSGYTCVGYDKWQQSIKQVSYDGGSTYENVVPPTYSATSLIEVNSEYCGYVPPVDGKFKLTLSNGTVVTGACDSTSAVTLNEISAYTATCVNAVIGDCVTRMYENLFTYSTTLSSCTIPNSVVRIDGGSFMGDFVNAPLKRINSDVDGVINLPTGLTRIDNVLFSACYNITTVYMPDGITSIGDSAFGHCSGITRINSSTNGVANLPSGLTSIEQFAFQYCKGLTSIVIPSGVTSIGQGAFTDCTSLTSVTVNAITPPTLGAGTNVFANTNYCPIYVPCASVDVYKAASGWSNYATRIHGIPPCEEPTPTGGTKFSATYNGGSTYSAECDSNTTLTSATTRPSGYQYTAMTSAIIGDCITEIGVLAFENLKSLTSLTIGSGVTNFDYLISDFPSPFDGANNLSNIIVDSNNSTYDSRNNCNAIIETSTNKLKYGCKSTVIPDSVTSIGNYAFEDCDKLTRITIPNSVTSIGGSAFDSCSGLTSIDIPNSVTYISSRAFSRCRGLTSCTIGSGVTSIGNWAFENCSALTNVTIQATTPPTLGMEVFENTKHCPIYVPAASVNAYKAASGWSDYASRIRAIP